jgi:hypothetical protein
LSKLFEITVGPTDETKAEIMGFNGPEYHVASLFVDQALGRKSAETLTAEYYLRQATDQRLIHSH